MLKRFTATVVQQSSDTTARSGPQPYQQQTVHRRYKNQLETQLNQTEQRAISAYWTLQPISPPSPAIQPAAKPLQTLQQAYQTFQPKPHARETLQEIMQPSQQIQQIAQSSSTFWREVESIATFTGTPVQPIQNVRSAAQGTLCTLVFCQFRSC